MKRNKKQSLRLLGETLESPVMESIRGDAVRGDTVGGDTRIKLHAPTTPGGLPDRRGQCEGQREPVERKGWTVRIVLKLVGQSGKCDSHPVYGFVS